LQTVWQNRVRAAVRNNISAHTLAAFNTNVDVVVHLRQDRLEPLLASSRIDLQEVEGLQIQGNPEEHRGAVSFTLDGVHPHDIGQLLDQEGIAIRAGHHCAQPLMKCLGVPATARLSAGLYNTREEIDMLASSLQGLRTLFHP